MEKKAIKSLNIRIEPKSAVPVYEQIKQGIKLLIISGYLEEGDQLVPIRELASALAVNPNTIIKVYYQLDVEGFLRSVQGSGYFVAFTSPDIKGEKGKLFQDITDEYISKALKLGFSLEEMNNELQRREKFLDSVE